MIFGKMMIIKMKILFLDLTKYMLNFLPLKISPSSTYHQQVSEQLMKLMGVLDPHVCIQNGKKHCGVVALLYGTKTFRERHDEAEREKKKLERLKEDVKE